MHQIPIIDLFAGPGGLGEGFATARDRKGRKTFNIGVSIEKDPIAHATLSLRAAFRHLVTPSAKQLYYDFIQGHIKLEEFTEHKSTSEALRIATKEARQATLGKTHAATIDQWIKTAIAKRNDWVLIGGPPCQAYSVAGRARRTNDESFEQDEKHFLYREYLRIIRRFEPAVFVMENVKGMLSSKHSGSLIFELIMSELSRPKIGLDYEIRSFVCHPSINGHLPSDFVIKSEQYGIPQTRHRVILLGIRRDYASRQHDLLKIQDEVKLGEMLADMPKIRGRVSKHDGFEAWHSALKETTKQFKRWKSPDRMAIEELIVKSAELALQFSAANQITAANRRTTVKQMPASLEAWIREAPPPSICQHESRSHMISDLQRYAFASSFAIISRRSPKLKDFPPLLLPKHKNVNDKNVPNTDRFRVQLNNKPCGTVVSHIAKDGHHFIHPDPSQCRSLTVREAARLQTFPDNYFFMGGRTQQFAQVGNAVPPFLAKQLGEIIAKLIK